MSDESKANLFLIYIVALTIYSYINTDYIATLMSQSTLPIAFVIHMITNPAYLLIVFGLVYWRNDKKMQAFLAGILLVVAIDIISLPKIGVAIPSMEAGILTNIDAVVALAAMKQGMSFPLFRLLYYVALPLSLIYLSVRLLGIQAFWSRIKGMGK